MSTRKITITVQNNTGCILSLSHHKLEHGKWLTSPSENIADKASDIWEAGNKDGALIGTTGTVTYTGGDATFKIDFDHPYGSSDTVVKHSATGNFDSKLDNDNLQHHDASCTIQFYKLA